MENQLYQKIFDNISKVASQLEVTAAQMRRTVKIFAGVVNWFDQSIYLNQDDYQGVVNKLEPNEEQERHRWRLVGYVVGKPQPLSQRTGQEHRPANSSEAVLR
jgi:hypothetical protein